MAGHSKKVVLVALLGNTIITIVKFIVALFTRSAAMLAEAIHSLADTGNQGLLLLGLHRSQKPADANHPFGYGKEQYFWSFVVANMLFFIGAVVSVYEGVSKLSHPHPIESAWLIYTILAVSFSIEFFAFRTAFIVFKKSRVKGQSYFSAVRNMKDSNVLVVLLEDSAALTGLLIAFLGVLLTELTGIAVFDALASILIGVVLAVVAMLLAWKTKELLIGESAKPSDLVAMRAVLDKCDQVKNVGELFTMHMAPDRILLGLNLEFIDELTSNDIESVIDELEASLKAAVPSVDRIFIEADELVVRKRTSSV